MTRKRSAAERKADKSRARKAQRHAVQHVYLPFPDVIQAECKLIRASWSKIRLQRDELYRPLDGPDHVIVDDRRRGRNVPAETPPLPSFEE